MHFPRWDESHDFMTSFLSDITTKSLKSLHVKKNKLIDIMQRFCRVVLRNDCFNVIVRHGGGGGRPGGLPGNLRDAYFVYFQFNFVLL